VLSIPDSPFVDSSTAASDRSAPEARAMQYLVLIYSEEGSGPPDPERVGGVMVEYDAYSKLLRDRGAFVAGDALWPTSSATTVRLRDGKTVMTDGPFAETKEALGGYYQIEAKDLDEALLLAAACPGARWGSVEVRPIVDFAAGQVPG
jgi:hypothetical protein